MFRGRHRKKEETTTTSKKKVEHVLKPCKKNKKIYNKKCMSHGMVVLLGWQHSSEQHDLSRVGGTAVLSLTAPVSWSSGCCLSDG